MIRKVLLPLSLAYPFLYYFSQGEIDPRWIALIPLTMLTVQAWPRLKRKFNKPAAFAIISFAACLFFWKSVLSLKLYPVGVSLTLAGVFGAGLLRPPSFIQKIAQLYEGPLSPRGLAYTRKVTWAWFIFCLLNGAVAAYTVWLGDDRIWAMYNGLISYLLMGCLAGGELLTRRIYKAKDKRDIENAD